MPELTLFFFSLSGYIVQVHSLCRPEIIICCWGDPALFRAWIRYFLVFQFPESCNDPDPTLTPMLTGRFSLGAKRYFPPRLHKASCGTLNTEARILLLFATCGREITEIIVANCNSLTICWLCPSHITNK